VMAPSGCGVGQGGGFRRPGRGYPVGAGSPFGPRHPGRRRRAAGPRATRLPRAGELRIFLVASRPNGIYFCVGISVPWRSTAAQAGDKETRFMTAAESSKPPRRRATANPSRCHHVLMPPLPASFEAILRWWPRLHRTEPTGAADVLHPPGHPPAGWRSSVRMMSTMPDASPPRLRTACRQRASVRAQMRPCLPLEGAGPREVFRR